MCVVLIRAPPRPTSEPGKKKIAPPRPPPPKASAQLKAVQNAVVFAGMISQPKKQIQLPLTSSVTAPDLLINWDSPPTSPTPGRSSSDCLSLKSFGSDSSGTHGAFSTMTRSESGFESEPDAWSETAVSVAAPVRNGMGEFILMHRHHERTRNGCFFFFLFMRTRDCKHDSIE